VLTGQEAASAPRLDAESRRVATQTGPARFLAVQLGTDAEISDPTSRYFRLVSVAKHMHLY